jgi:photosystem II stability/assembly factor-like uncharacterized protein
MKKVRSFIILVGILLISCNSGMCQWFYQQLTPGKNLNSLSFPDENTGYICGYSQTLLKTTDGGVTWNQLNINSKGNLISINFPSNNTGYLASDSGQIFKTTDGGQNWIIIKSFNVRSWYLYKYRLFFFNDNEGLLAGDSSVFQGRMYRTTDGGITWTNSILPDSIYPEYYHPDEFCFLSPSTGYLISDYTILKTVDGGRSWTLLENQMGGPSVSFTDTIHGFLIYQKTLFESHDGGVNWNMIDDNDPSTYVLFTSKDTGYLCKDTTIMQTTDAGTSWKSMRTYGIPSGFTVPKTEMCFPSKNIGYAVGPGGGFFKCNLNAIGIGEKQNVQPVVQLVSNPVTGLVIRFRIQAATGNSEMHIYSCLGVEVKKAERIISGLVEIDCSDLSRGVYFYRYFNNGATFATGKVILN